METTADLCAWLIAGEIFPEDLVGWLQSSKCPSSTVHRKLAALGDDIRRGFVPYFLHYLREETAAHTQPQQSLGGGGGASATPSVASSAKPSPSLGGSTNDLRKKRVTLATAQSSPRERLFADAQGGNNEDKNGADRRHERVPPPASSPMERIDGAQSRRLNDRMQGRKNKMSFNDRLNKNGNTSSGTRDNGHEIASENHQNNQHKNKSNQQRNSNRQTTPTTSSSSRRVQLSSPQDLMPPPPPPPPKPFCEEADDFPALNKSTASSPLTANSVTPKRRIRPTPVNLSASKEEFTQSSQGGTNNASHSTRKKKNAFNSISNAEGPERGPIPQRESPDNIFQRDDENASPPSPVITPESQPAPTSLPPGLPPPHPSFGARTTPTTTSTSNPVKPKKRAIFTTLSPIAPIDNVRSLSLKEKENVPPMAVSPRDEKKTNVSSVSSHASLIALNGSASSVANGSSMSSFSSSSFLDHSASLHSSRGSFPNSSSSATTGGTSSSLPHGPSMVSGGSSLLNTSSLAASSSSPWIGGDSSLLSSVNDSSAATSSTATIEASDPVMISPVKSARFFLPSSFTTPVKPKKESEESESPDLPKDSSTPCKPSPAGRNLGSQLKDFVSAASVKEIAKLDRLAHFYQLCLSENLVTNLAVEIYFLMDLMSIAKAPSRQELESLVEEEILSCSSLFVSPHNVVYFAVETLFRLKEIVLMFDRGLLRMLAENSRIESFKPEFSAQLNDFLKKNHEETQEFSFVDHSIHGADDVTPGVPFQPEVDDRSNFPCDKSFHHFKKIRDTFYELLREWQDAHATAGWTMNEALGSRIVALVRSTHQHLATRVHFSRLFKSQLLLMCAGSKGKAGVVEGETEEEAAFLSKMKRTNPEKYSRLRERFTKQTIFLGPSPPPTFTGMQEFFHDFVLIADCNSFNQNLSDILQSDISDLSNSLLDLDDEREFDNADGNASINPEQKAEILEKFTESFQKLTVLAKFFGLVTFFAYQTKNKLPPAIQADFLGLRKNSYLENTLQLVAKHLETSFTTGKLILDVPWIVAFMAQIDPVSLTLRPAVDILSRLSSLHHALRFANLEIRVPMTNRLLLVFQIGWLFDTYANVDSEMVSVHSPDLSHHPLEFTGLDALPIVQEKFLQNACSFLKEIKLKFCEFSSGSNKRQGGAASSQRKITPLCMSSSSASGFKDASIRPPATQKESAEKQLHLSIRASFFSLHPASMKKSVEFVAERISSKSIKKLKSFAKTHLLAKSKEDLKEKIHPGSSPNISQWIRKEAQKAEEELQSEHASTTADFCRAEIKGILPALISPEMDPRVVDFAVTIAAQMATEKVTNWIGTYLDLKYFEKELTSEWDKLEKAAQKALQAEVEETAPAATPEVVRREPRLHRVGGSNLLPSQLLINFKELFQSLILGQFGRGESPESAIRRCHDDAYHAILHRDDFHPMAFKSLARVSCDLILFYLRHAESLSSHANLIESVLKLWSLAEIKGVVVAQLESKRTLPGHELSCASLTKRLLA